jgi:hypothetical protein
MKLEVEDLEKLFPGRTDYVLHSMDMVIALTFLLLLKTKIIF